MITVKERIVDHVSIPRRTVSPFHLRLVVMVKDSMVAML